MKKEPVVSHRWWSKIFFPHLLLTQAYRHIFRNKAPPTKRQLARYQTITNVLSFGYVLIGSTMFGFGKLHNIVYSSQNSPGLKYSLTIYQYSIILAYYAYTVSGAAANETENTALFYARIAGKGKDDENHKFYHVKVFDGFQKTDITDQVRKSNHVEPDEEYDKYTDPKYIRKRFDVPEGSSKDENFNLELAGIYARRLDAANKLRDPTK